MRSGARWQRRVTHVGMRLLLLLLRLRLRGMSVNHPGPGKHSTSFRNHCFFGWDIYEVALSLTTVGVRRFFFCFQCCSVN